MRKALFPIFLSVLLVLTMFFVVSSNSEVVSWWPAEGNANDIVGTNHGTLENGATFAPGIVGLAFSFDGVDDFVNLGRPTNLQLQTLSVSAWVKPTSMPNAPLGILSYGVPSWAIGVEGYFDGDVYFGADGLAGVSTGAYKLPLNVWTHVAATSQDNGGLKTVKIYINGEEMPLTLTNNDYPLPLNLDFQFDDPTKQNLGLGGTWQWWVSRWGNYFPGLIDEVKVYNRALSSQEIQAIYNEVMKVMASIDIDPNTLNLKSNGEWITAYITLPEGHSVEDIDVNTVLLKHHDFELPADWSVVEAPPVVLTIKFDRATLRDYLGEVDVDDGEKFYDITLTVTGSVAGTPFEGSDTITVKRK
ncbi:MAG: LamG domain-containing protein [Candidatus Bathyarchaeota archaeon]|nr:MAG: LamG domain-containing protein [Candidatus Bathyarchaeota archaeon]